jgi:lipoate-protein ligase A
MAGREGLNAWRLIAHDPSSGAWNMAVDEAILHHVADGESPPTLRLYGWQPACISLGRAQPSDDIDQDQLIQRGWELVRRPTGGRAILHQNELTYAVIAPEDHPLMRGGVLESYRRISEALVCGLEQLAIEVEVRGSDPVSEEVRANPICFEVPSAYEITVLGRKIMGSAQVRKRKTVLQHGSLPLTGDLGQICDVLQYQSDVMRENAKRELLKQAATLETLIGSVISWDEAAEAFMNGFQEVLRNSLTPLELTSEEEATAEQLMKTRYQNRAWTFRGTRNNANVTPS